MPDGTAPPPTHLSGTRLFARIVELDFECPRCGSIYTIRRGRYPAGWNPRSGIFKCKACSLSIQFGVLMYPVSVGAPHLSEIPEDWVPTPAQAASLRQLQTGIHLDPAYKRPRSPLPRNLRGRACLCLVDAEAGTRTTHPACPVHGAGRPPAGPTRG